MKSAVSLDPVARLVRGLDLEEVRRDVFRGRTGKGEGRLFGGLLLAQAIMATGRSVPDRRLHSLHAYFLRPGRSRVPIDFRVERVRDGIRFATRRAVGRQSGKEIIIALASFVGSEQGFSHQAPMPVVPGPDGLRDWEDLRAEAFADPSKRRPDVAMDVRVCDPDDPDPTVRSPARCSVWIRLRGTLPEDPLMHAAALAFVSDRTLLRVAARPHSPIWRIREAASVDHALWLHRPVRFDDWVLYTCESPAAETGRALAFGAIYTRDGKRVASVAQEGILRL